MAPGIAALAMVAAGVRTAERVAAGSVTCAGPRPTRVTARAAWPCGDGCCLRGRSCRGKGGQLFLELGRVALRAARNGARAYEGFKFLSALAARVFEDWHVWFLVCRTLWQTEALESMRLRDDRATVSGRARPIRHRTGLLLVWKTLPVLSYGSNRPGMTGSWILSRLIRMTGLCRLAPVGTRHHRAQATIATFPRQWDGRCALAIADASCQHQRGRVRSLIGASVWTRVPSTARVDRHPQEGICKWERQ